MFDYNRLSKYLFAIVLILGLSVDFGFGECQTAYIVSRRLRLVRANVKTGVTERIGDFDPSIRPVGGLAVDQSTEKMYVIGNLNTNNATLIEIDRHTAAVNNIVGYVGFRAKALTIDDATGKLYTLDRYGDKLYELDPTNNAAATLIADSSSDPINLEAIAVDSSGTLYGTHDGDLYKVDLTTGSPPFAIVKVGRITETFGLDMNSLFFRPNNDRFYAFGKADGQATHEAPIFVIRIDEMRAIYKGVSEVNNPFGGDLICGIADEF